MKDHTHYCHYCPECDTEYDIEILSYSPGDEGCTSGPPDNWYPPEAAEVDYKAKCPECGHVDESEKLCDAILASIEEDAREDALEMYWENRRDDYESRWG